MRTVLETVPARYYPGLDEVKRDERTGKWAENVWHFDALALQHLLANVSQS